MLNHGINKHTLEILGKLWATCVNERRELINFVLSQFELFFRFCLLTKHARTLDTTNNIQTFVLYFFSFRKKFSINKIS